MTEPLSHIEARDLWYKPVSVIPGAITYADAPLPDGPPPILGVSQLPAPEMTATEEPAATPVPDAAEPAPAPPEPVAVAAPVVAPIPAPILLSDDEIRAHEAAKEE